MTLRPLFALALGCLLLLTAGQALADRDDRRGYRGEHRGDNRWHHGGARYTSHRYRDRGWRNEHRRDWRHRRGNNVRIYHNYRHRPDYTGIIGGVLIGSAITHSLHNAYDERRFYGSSGIVSGCYRIERLGGGRERRVELPLSWCR